jgi:hypothetical protein
VWDDTLGKPAEIGDLLMAAWVRRKKLEAQWLAAEIVNRLALAMGGEQRETRRTSGDALLHEMGVM